MDITKSAEYLYQLLNPTTSQLLFRNLPSSSQHVYMDHVMEIINMAEEEKTTDVGVKSLDYEGMYKHLKLEIENLLKEIEEKKQEQEKDQNSALEWNQPLKFTVYSAKETVLSWIYEKLKNIFSQ
jgi:hypothetical protein